MMPSPTDCHQADFSTSDITTPRAANKNISKTCESNNILTFSPTRTPPAFLRTPPQKQIRSRASTWPQGSAAIHGKEIQFHSLSSDGNYLNEAPYFPHTPNKVHTSGMKRASVPATVPLSSKHKFPKAPPPLPLQLDDSPSHLPFHTNRRTPGCTRPLARLPTMHRRPSHPPASSRQHPRLPSLGFILRQNSLLTPQFSEARYDSSATIETMLERSSSSCSGSSENNKSSSNNSCQEDISKGGSSEENDIDDAEMTMLDRVYIGLEGATTTTSSSSSSSSSEENIANLPLLNVDCDSQNDNGNNNVAGVRNDVPPRINLRLSTNFNPFR